MMEDQELKKALSRVGKALDKVNRAFKNHLHELKSRGSDQTMIRQATEAVNAMRDSATMYLAWAHHYTGIPQPDEPLTPSEEMNPDGDRNSNHLG
jgi:hypothetical protein